MRTFKTFRQALAYCRRNARFRRRGFVVRVLDLEGAVTRMHVIRL